MPDYVIRPDARLRPLLPRDEIMIRAPRPLAEPPARPSLTTLLPLLIVAVVALFAIMVSGANLVSSLIFLVSGPALAGGQILTYRLGIRRHAAEMREQEEEYDAYLKESGDRLAALYEEVRDALWDENPAVETLIKRIEGRSPRLWQRLPGDEDFLDIRLGTGLLPPSFVVTTDIKEQAEDDLAASGRRLQQRYATVPGLPITLNLEKLGLVGVRGRGNETLPFIYSLLAHLVTHQSPDEVHLYIVSGRRDAPHAWRFARWLPHTRASSTASNQPPPLAYTPETTGDLLAELARRLEARLENRPATGDYGPTDPHIVVIFDRLRTIRQHKVVTLLLNNRPAPRSENALRASAIFIDQIPPQINALVEIQGESFLYRQTWPADEPVALEGDADRTTLKRIERLARAMAPLRTEGQRRVTAGHLPSNVRLVELLGATQPKEIDLAAWYSDAYDPRRVMAFPLGLNTESQPLRLTLREDSRGGHGPHAILAGGTSKGKSVTLQSVVLGLAATNSPSHLNIVLADFKGGASELARLKALPHVVGFVTDLEERLVERFRLALAGELLRRKRLLEDTPRTMGRQISNIYEYNLAGPETLLPHLLVVVDEFAKARNINPELAQTLEKDIAAQGRAVGVHLLLSTQKPADFATVRSNIEVRLSMQTNTVDDSRTIFKRDDAFSRLTRAGQALVQVGDNRIFEMFQVARTDIPFVPDGQTSINLVDDFEIRLMEDDGRLRTLHRHRAPSSGAAPDGHSLLSEAEILVEHIRSYCESRYPSQRIIWLPPLPRPEDLPLFSLLDGHDVYCRWSVGDGWAVDEKQQPLRLKVPLGMLDLPAQQAQRPYLLDLTERDGNFLVVGPAGSGRLLTLQSLALALAATHPPDELLLYLISRGPALAAFEELPHCQAFVQPGEEERLMRLFSFLEREVDRRVRWMREARADRMAVLRATRPDLPVPSLVVIFEDFADFIADHFERLQEMESLAIAGRQVDLHLVLSVNSMGGVHTRLQNVMNNRLALGAANTMDVLDRRTRPLQPITGRGYVLHGREAVECQIATPWPESGALTGTRTAADEARDLISRMRDQWSWPDGQRPLPAIDILPKYVSLPELWEAPYRHPTIQEQPTAPLGRDYALEPVWIEFNVLEPYNLVVGPARSGKSDFLMTLALATAQNFAPDQATIYLFALKPSSPLRHLSPLPQVFFAGSAGVAQRHLEALKTKLKERAERQREQGSQTKTGTLKLANYLPHHTLILIDDLQLFTRHEGLNGLLDGCLAEGSPATYLFLAETGNRLNQLKQNYGLKYLATASRFGAGFAFSVENGDLGLLQLLGKIRTPELKQHEATIGQGRGFWANQGGYRVVQIARVAPPKAPAAAVRENIEMLVTGILRRHQAESPPGEA